MSLCVTEPRASWWLKPCWATFSVYPYAHSSGTVSVWMRGQGASLVQIIIVIIFVIVIARRGAQALRAAGQPVVAGLVPPHGTPWEPAAPRFARLFSLPDAKQLTAAKGLATLIRIRARARRQGIAALHCRACRHANAAIFNLVIEPCQAALSVYAPTLTVPELDRISSSPLRLECLCAKIASNCRSVVHNARLSSQPQGGSHERRSETRLRGRGQV